MRPDRLTESSDVDAPPTNGEFLGRLFDGVDLIKQVSNIRPSIRTCVHTSVSPSTKSFLDFNEIWHVVRGR